MKLVIQGKNIEITDSIRNYVHQKIEKAVSHYQNLTMEVDVHLSVARNPRISTQQQIAEVTIYVNGAIIRAEESSEVLYASIDMVADKVARRLRKYKEKRSVKRDHASLKALPVEPLEANGTLTPAAVEEILANGQAALPQNVVRMKYFPMPPMDVEHALEQLQLVGHDFYMFHNSETDEINVIYKRNHGGYGVLQPRPVSNLKLDTNGRLVYANGYSSNGHSGNGHSGNGHHSNGHSGHGRQLNEEHNAKPTSLSELPVPAAQVMDS